MANNNNKITERRISASQPTIAIINASTVMTDAELQTITNDLQIQLDRDYSDYWFCTARLALVPKGQTPPRGSWWLSCLDDPDISGALGYHDITPEGLPLGKAFVKLDLDNGYLPSVTISHELLEMLEDPYISYTVQVELENGRLRDYALEVCDACEADELGYKINTTTVSDFVTPAFFELYNTKGPFDFQKKVSKPFEILPDGYIGYIDLGRNTGWQIETADKPSVKTLLRSRAQIGSRRERRRIPKSQWVKSEPVGKIIQNTKRKLKQ